MRKTLRIWQFILLGMFTRKNIKENKYLMVNDYMLNKVLDKIKETIDIVKFDDTKILIDTDDKLPDYITFKNVVILITYVIKDDAKFYTQIFLEEALYNEKALKKDRCMSEDEKKENLSLLRNDLSTEQ